MSTVYDVCICTEVELSIRYLIQVIRQLGLMAFSVLFNYYLCSYLEKGACLCQHVKKMGICPCARNMIFLNLIKC